ncbi:hypothetical protein ACFWWS_25655 [Streptomyces sp. NPDC059083]|uniref:hypothetical protein n=1 Tax=Streptomyces sp. NPDC059083 TaxID=3346721 RepID=UPI0036A4E7F3
MLESSPLLPTLAEFAAVDRALQDAGRHIVDMWASLGVTARLTDDEQLYVSVA